MVTSLKGFRLIQRWEGLELDAYQCPAGVWTIGYGSTHNVKEGMKITKDGALILLTRDVIGVEDDLYDLQQ